MGSVFKKIVKKKQNTHTKLFKNFGLQTVNVKNVKAYMYVLTYALKDICSLSVYQTFKLILWQKGCGRMDKHLDTLSTCSQVRIVGHTVNMQPDEDCWFELAQ